MPNLTQDQGDQLVEWTSEIGDLSYQIAPDPSDVGIQIRLRVQSIKAMLGAGPPGSAPGLMYDSTTANDIPPNAAIVAGYMDGRFAWSQADWDRFPSARKLSITVFGNTGADVGDVESGDMTPVEGANWWRRTGGKGWVYCSASVVPLMNALGVPTDHIWVADWTGVPHLWGDSPATQYADPAAGSGGHYDVSLVR